MIFNLTQPVLDSAPKFTYTGTYEYIDDGDGNWRIKFLSSGVFTPLKNMAIDAFLVGGGGGSKGGSSNTSTTAGAGGGYTATHKAINLTSGTAYNIVVGAGGVGNNTGGQTSAFGNSVDGGAPGETSSSTAYGGSGGSGGGRAPSRESAYDGGSDGADGGGYSDLSPNNGKGQGTTTREFGEPNGDLYAGGGGGHNSDGNASGGNGGGADGGQSAQDNTGGGAGGATRNGDASGGSGIVVIRKHKEAAA